MDNKNFQFFLQYMDYIYIKLIFQVLIYFFKLWCNVSQQTVCDNHIDIR